MSSLKWLTSRDAAVQTSSHIGRLFELLEFIDLVMSKGRSSKGEMKLENVKFEDLTSMLSCTCRGVSVQYFTEHGVAYVLLDDGKEIWFDLDSDIDTDTGGLTGLLLAKS